MTKAEARRHGCSARELQMFADNSQTVYFNGILPAMKRLHKTYKNGWSDFHKAEGYEIAEKEYIPVMTLAAEEYNKKYGSSNFSFGFTWLDKKMAADIQIDKDIDQIIKGDF